MGVDPERHLGVDVAEVRLDCWNRPPVLDEEPRCQSVTKIVRVDLTNPGAPDDPIQAPDAPVVVPEPATAGSGKQPAVYRYHSPGQMLAEPARTE